MFRMTRGAANQTRLFDRGSEMFSLSHGLGITALMLINRQNIDVIH